MTQPTDPNLLNSNEDTRTYNNLRALTSEEIDAIRQIIEDRRLALDKTVREA